MKELADGSVHLVVTSPPYFNAPFDYPGLFENYEAYLNKMNKVAKELKRVVAQGRIVCIVCDDVLVEGKKYPIVADLTKIYVDNGFNYRDRITWIKPEGYIRISRRSGVLLQHPYPMYFYPDNVQETILIFQNGEFDYKGISEEAKEFSVAAFPEEIPYRLIKLFSYVGETVLDPFMGSGTTNKVALILKRNSVGYEIDVELVDIVKEKMGLKQRQLFEKDYEVEIIIRDDAKHLRTHLQDKVKMQRSVARNVIGKKNKVAFPKKNEMNYLKF